MSDTDSDPQMTRYLTQSAVPDHAPEFWDNLDRQMDTIDHGNPKAALLVAAEADESEFGEGLPDAGHGEV